MRRRPAGPTRPLLARLAVVSAASLAVVASGSSVALAEDPTSTDEGDPSGQTSGETSDPRPSDEQAPDEGAEGSGPEAEETPDGGPGTDLEGGGDVEDTDEAEPPVVAPVYGNQKLRIGVQQADGSWLPDGASFVGTTMSITISGGVDDEGEPLADESTTCTVTEAYPTTCVPESDYAEDTTDLDLDAGRTAVITPTSAPTGLVVAPAVRVVGPRECDGGASGCSFYSVPVSFTVTAVPASFTVGTPQDTPVAIDVLTDDDLGAENAVTGVTVTQQPANGTAVVTGQLPPVEEPPVEEPPVDEVATLVDPGSAGVVRATNASFSGASVGSFPCASTRESRRMSAWS